MVGKLTKDDELSASTVANAMGKGKYKSKQRQLQEHIKPSMVRLSGLTRTLLWSWETFLKMAS
jgi:hypothetical protein